MKMRPKYDGKSEEYKNVYRYKDIMGEVKFVGQIQIKGTIRKREFKDEREAAKWVDMRLIEAGKEPVNVMKRK